MPAPAPQIGDERIPFRGVRKKIAENMHRSRQTAAHFTYVEECDVTELVSLRKRAKSRAEERGIKLSFLPFIVKAVVAGLKKFPIVNATLDENAQEIVLRKRYHIGVAAASDAGLIVPMLKDADQEVAVRHRRRIGNAVRKRRAPAKPPAKTSPARPSPSRRWARSAAYWPRPSSTIRKSPFSACTKSKPRPWSAMDRSWRADIMNLSISLDHRIVDGYESAQFLARS